MENLVKELKLVITSEDNNNTCYGTSYETPTNLEIALADLNKTLEKHFKTKE